MQIAFSIVRGEDVSIGDVLRDHVLNPNAAAERNLFVCSNPACREPVSVKAVGSEHRIPHFAHAKAKTPEQRLECDMRCSGLTPAQRQKSKSLFRAYKVGLFAQRAEHYIACALYAALNKEGFPVVFFNPWLDDNRKYGPRLMPMNDVWVKRHVNNPVDPATYISRQDFVKQFKDDIAVIRGNKTLSALTFNDASVRAYMRSMGKFAADPMYQWPPIEYNLPNGMPGDNRVEVMAAKQGLSPAEFPSYRDAAEALVSTAVSGPSPRIRDALTYATLYLEAGSFLSQMHRIDAEAANGELWNAWSSRIESAQLPNNYEESPELDAYTAATTVGNAFLYLAALHTEIRLGRSGVVSRVTADDPDVSPFLKTEDPKGRDWMPFTFIEPFMLSCLPLAPIFKEIAASAFCSVDAELEATHSRQGFIYAMHSEELSRLWCTNVVKIGYSKNPLRRAKELGGQLFGKGLEIAKIWSVDDMPSAERHIHTALRRRQLDTAKDREIFRLTADKACIEVDRLLALNF